MSSSTPMMAQYNELKQRHSDCLLLFRMGDFYEGFNEDARILSKVLGITLTGRGKDGNRTPMAGIPYHALKQYLPKLIEAGHRVAIAEQASEPKPGQIVDRKVVRIVTAGTIIEDEILSSSVNNYLVALSKNKLKNKYYVGISILDLSTGFFTCSELVSNQEVLPRVLIEELFRVGPAEIVIAKQDEHFFSTIKQTFKVYLQEDHLGVSQPEAERALIEFFNTNSLKGFGIEDQKAAIHASAMILKYLEYTQKQIPEHITSLSSFVMGQYMHLDQATIRNLEILYPLRADGKDKNTLFGCINKCKTNMGQRLLRYWLLRPLIDEAEINERQECVQFFYDDSVLLAKVVDLISNIPDLDRVVGRIGSKSANARDLIFLKNGLINSIQAIELIRKQTKKPKLLDKEFSQFNNLKDDVISLIEASIDEDPPMTITEGNIIKKGYSSDLDELKNFEQDGKNYVRNLQAREIERTGIASLKVRFNKVFGYYIEVSKSNLAKVPDNYIRKQTLVGAERYITEELKEWEEKILNAESKSAEMEYSIFEKIRSDVVDKIEIIKELSSVVASIDVFSNFATLAVSRNYNRPLVSNNGSETIIIKGRHPVVEESLSVDYISNDTKFVQGKEDVLILTGPNMSGKSTYIRQVAIIFLMSQIGSFVPADSAVLPIVDRVFTRVGASDNLATGESTFMVEMNETANILNNATQKSLIILDEVGRGTSTYDGVAIAWSIVEFIATKLGARTLFATHYHELIQLEASFENVINYNVYVKEYEGKILFMREIRRGGTDKSYGIHVAKLAGVPPVVINRANAILKRLEIRSQSKTGNTPEQLTFASNEVKISDTDSLLDGIDINSITPIQALNLLKELKDKRR